MITLHNLKYEATSEPYDFLIDKRTPVGNMFWRGDGSHRALACASYDKWARKTAEPAYIKMIEVMTNVYLKYGRLRLFCHCVPLQCHGETIKTLIKEKLDDFKYGDV